MIANSPLSFETSEPASLKQLYNRLSSKETSEIISSRGEDHYEFMRQTFFNVDGTPTKAVFAKLVKMVHDAYKTKCDTYLEYVRVMCSQNTHL